MKRRSLLLALLTPTALAVTPGEAEARRRGGGGGTRVRTSSGGGSRGGGSGGCGSRGGPGYRDANGRCASWR